MARSSLQKLKILYVMDYLLRNSDENHPISVAQLIADLSNRGIAAERKSIYDDIECSKDGRYIRCQRDGKDEFYSWFVPAKENGMPLSSEKVRQNPTNVASSPLKSP